LTPAAAEREFFIDIARCDSLLQLFHTQLDLPQYFLIRGDSVVSQITDDLFAIR
jgi:hypothetical protein